MNPNLQPHLTPTPIRTSPSVVQHPHPTVTWPDTFYIPALDLRLTSTWALKPTIVPNSRVSTAPQNSAQPPVSLSPLCSSRPPAHCSAHPEPSWLLPLHLFSVWGSRDLCYQKNQICRDLHPQGCSWEPLLWSPLSPCPGLGSRYLLWPWTLPWVEEASADPCLPRPEAQAMPLPQKVFKGHTFCIKVRGNLRDFPGCAVVKTPRFQYRGRGFDPWLGN